MTVKPRCPKCGAGGPALEWRDMYLHTGEHLEEVFCLICGETLGTRTAQERKEESDVSKIGNCKECGKKRVSLPGRGLCSVCYRAERDAEKAEEEMNEVSVEPADVASVASENPALAVDQPEVAGPVAHNLTGDAPSFSDVLDSVLADLRSFLIAKNRAYGNSALDPVRVFSKVDPVEQLRVRIDDKLSRLFRGDAAGEDTERDLWGYLTLLEVARRWPCTSHVTSAVNR